MVCDARELRETKDCPVTGKLTNFVHVYFNEADACGCKEEDGGSKETRNPMDARIFYNIFDFISRKWADPRARMLVDEMKSDDVVGMDKTIGFLGIDLGQQRMVPWDGYMSMFESNVVATLALLPLVADLGDETLSMLNDESVEYDICALSAHLLVTDPDWIDAGIAQKHHADEEEASVDEGEIQLMLATLMARYPDIGKLSTITLVNAPLERVYRGLQVRVDVYSNQNYKEMIVNYQSSESYKSNEPDSTGPWIIL